MKFIITSTSEKKYDCLKTHEERIKWEFTPTHPHEDDFDVLEIDSIDRLLLLIDELKEQEDSDTHIGGVIIDRWWRNQNYWEIEIYDGYRE